MAAGSVNAVVAAHMTSEKPLHKGAECETGFGLQNEVEVVGHETEGEGFYREFGFCLGEQVDKSEVVVIFMENNGSGVATVNHMVDVIGDLSARDTRHKREWGRILTLELLFLFQQSNRARSCNPAPPNDPAARCLFLIPSF